MTKARKQALIQAREAASYQNLIQSVTESKDHIFSTG